MAGIIEAFRAVLLGTGEVNWGLIGQSLAVSCALCLMGIAIFRHRERLFADVV
jgi:ABC-type polysaccharide/polyol phosphate export permease